MNDRPIEGKSTIQRLFILTASLIVGAIGWFLMGESESIVAEPAAAKAPPETQPKEVLARVGDVELTFADMQQELAGELMKLERQRHQLMARGVENKVRDLLIEREAERRGLTREALIAQEVDAKLDTVPAADVDAFYEKGKAQIRQPKNSVEPQIRNYLAMERFVDALREAEEVDILTQPFRVDVEATGPSRGTENAAVTIIEFSDFECPYCKQATPVLDQLIDNYGDRVRLVYRHYPIDSIHPHARRAAEASLCAQEQDLFWPMHDRMFVSQRSLGVEGLKALAKSVGLEAAPFAECLASGRHSAAVEADFQAGQKLGVERTPAFFINGRYLSGAPSYEALEEIIQQELERSNTLGGSAG